MLDVRAHGRRPAGSPRRGSEESPKPTTNRAEIDQDLVDVIDFPANELEDVGTRNPSRALDRHDLFDLTQPEPEPSGARDEGENGQRIVPVHSVACGRAAGRGQNAHGLVQAQRRLTWLRAATSPIRRPARPMAGG